MGQRRLRERCDTAAEERIGRLGYGAGSRLTMYQLRHLEGEQSLADTARRVVGLLPANRRDLVQRQEGEDLQVALDIGVFSVDPVLVQLVGRGHRRIEEERVARGLAKLLPRRR